MTATTLTRESLLEAASARREADQLQYFGALSPQEAAALLAAYPWPGNIRQLENVLIQMVVMAGSGPLSEVDVPDEIQDWRDDEVLAESTAHSYWEARERFDRSFLCKALRRHNGVIAHVAEAIGVSRKHLYVRMDQLAIDYSKFRPAPYSTHQSLR